MTSVTSGDLTEVAGEQLTGAGEHLPLAEHKEVLSPLLHEDKELLSRAFKSSREVFLWMGKSLCYIK